MINRRRVLSIGAAALALPSCTASAKTTVQVYKDPSCGCCMAWIERLREAGFEASAQDRADMVGLKAKLGVPEDLQSCHTGIVGGYAIEGHVPPADIRRLLAQKPSAKGLAVPGMPVNSPGMEMPGEADEPYTVWLFDKDGARRAFAQHGAG